MPLTLRAHFVCPNSNPALLFATVLFNQNRSSAYKRLRKNVADKGTDKSTAAFMNNPDPVSGLQHSKFPRPVTAPSNKPDQSISAAPWYLPSGHLAAVQMALAFLYTFVLAYEIKV